MSIWRSPAVESLLGGASLDQAGLTEDVLRRLVEEGARENEHLDFKFHPHLNATKATPSERAVAEPSKKERGFLPEQEFAKDVCSFANHLGGVLLIGIEDDQEVAVNAIPTVTDPGAVEQRLRTAAANYATPLPRFHFIAIPASSAGESGDHYLAIVVPPSAAAPHAVRGHRGDAKRPLHYPVRDGADTRYLLEHEVADRYHARSAARAVQDALLEETIRQGRSALQYAPDDRLWLYLVAVPESPVPERLERSTADAIKNWLSSAGLYSPLGTMLLFQGTPTPAPGRLTVSGSGAAGEAEVETDPRDHYIEIYADGRVFVATALDTRRTEREPSALAELNLIDDTIMLTDYAVGWASHQAGSWGTATLAAGITAKGPIDGPFAAPLTLHGGTSGSLSRIRGTRPVRGTIQAVTSADLGDGQDLQGRLRAARDVLTVLLQHFGVAEPDQLKPDGTIKRYGWNPMGRSQIEQWAQERGVASTDH